MIHRQPRRSLTHLLPAAALLLASAAVLVRFPPEQFAFYPRCPIFAYFHLLCPGCGTTRALAALLRGHLLQALQLNPLTTLLFPAALFYCAHHLRQRLRDSHAHWPHPPTYAVYGLLVITALFTIVRNLPI